MKITHRDRGEGETSLSRLKIRRGGTCGDITIICETVH
jgi:hypothetical protein